MSRNANSTATALPLRELQTRFADSVYMEESADFLSYVAPGRFPPEQLVQIYRNNVFVSLTDALADVYPVVTRLVGEGFLKYASDAFIRTHPPRSGNLHDFGSEFAAFLADFPPAAELAYLPDVARLEWAYHCVFHAPEVDTLSPMELAKVPPDQYGEIRFALHPAIRLLDSDYPILSIWRVNQPDYEGDDSVNLSEGGVKLMIARRQLEIEFQLLSDGEFQWLSTLAQGRRFAEACRAALEVEPGFDLTRTLQQHVLQGTLVDFNL